MQTPTEKAKTLIQTQLNKLLSSEWENDFCYEEGVNKFDDETREELNQIQDKLNEIIETMNKGGK